MRMPEPQELVCAVCGSDQVSVEARAIWNSDKQRFWIRQTPHAERGHCNKCESNVALKFVPLAPKAEAAA